MMIVFFTAVSVHTWWCGWCGWCGWWTRLRIACTRASERRALGSWIDDSAVGRLDTSSTGHTARGPRRPICDIAATCK